MSAKPVCLLVDDDPDDREIFSLALQSIDPDILCTYANDGDHALQVLLESSKLPDFIFMDINMPKMNGIKCLREIKKHDRLKDIPLYMYSTSSNPRLQSETISEGAMDYFVKPNSISELFQILKELIH